MEESASLQTPSYRAVRRKLLDQNPYFQKDLLEVRRKLGIPEMGFEASINEIEKEIPRDSMGLRTGKPDLDALDEKAQQLGIPLRERLDEWRALFSKQGRDFDQSVEQIGWGALPIFSAFDWAAWWVDRERKSAGSNTDKLDQIVEQASSPSQLWDERLPSRRASMYLVRRYDLGEDFAPAMSSGILGVAPPGGEADVIIEPRSDGAGVSIILNCVGYNCTQAQWAKLFHDYIQPTLLSVTGKLQQGLPYYEALAQAKRGSKSGRPPYNDEVLDRHMKMWAFCEKEGFLAEQKSPTPAAFDKFLYSLDDEELSQFENIDRDILWRTVKKMDELMRPTKSTPDF